MSIDWSPLTRELALWRDEGLTLPLWWRDDDATAPTPALERLTALSDASGLPVHLAVIPAQATPALAREIARQEGLIPLVHGWQHMSHANSGDKKAEFPATRPLQDRIDDARRGIARMTDLLGTPPAPIFVPPWNRISADMIAALPDLGFAALSTFGARPARFAAPGLQQINTHLDPIFWRGTRSLVPPAQLIDQLASDLADRRADPIAAQEPYGLLTHHLVHDAPIWDFTAELIARLCEGPVTPWSATKEFPHEPT